MKKALSISLTALLLTTGAAQAEQLAAWTFSNLASPLSTSYQNNYGSQTASFNLTGQGTSNNLTINNPNDSAFADVIYKGTTYSGNNLDPQNRFDPELFPNDQDGYVAFKQYRTNYNPLRSDASGKTFSIVLDSQDPTLGYGNLNFTYAAAASQNASNSAGSFSIEWKVSFDGGEFITLGTDTFTAGASATEYGHLISGSGSSVVITGTLSLAVPQSGASSNTLAFDTFILNGEQIVVPEPATYALILGALGLGFVVIRRRAAKRA